MTSYFAHSAGSPAPTGTPTSPASPSGTSAARPTALTNRLTSVLSASYTDTDIRDALGILDDRGIQNTPETRRTLRLDIQKEVIDSNGKIIQDFGKVADQLSRIGTAISSLNTTCENMRNHIKLARLETGPVLEEASALIDQKEEVETKEKLLDSFTKHFVISDDELLRLTSSAEPVDDKFFEATARTKQIHKDCEVLLGGENQRLGLEIMEQSSKALNSAYQKLYKWIQREFKSRNLEDPQMSGSIRRALRVLAERPSLFHSCLDSFAEAREDILSEGFHFALTGTSGDGAEPVSKPIEFNAHDPPRYVGDMLAWVYSTAVSEREALEALFISDGGELARGIQAGITTEPWSRVDSEEAPFDGRKTLTELVTRDLSGVARSLRQRTELVVQGHDDPVTLYKVINLLSFYEATFSKLVGADSPLVETVVSLRSFTFQRFEILLQDTVSFISSEPSSLIPPDDLSAPDFIIEALATLTALMKEYDSSFKLEPTDELSQGENKFTPVVRAALDPFMELAKESSNRISDPTRKAIFQANYLLAIRSSISTYPFVCATHITPVSNALTVLRTQFLEIQHEFLLNSSGLQILLAALKPFTASLPGSSGGTHLEVPQTPHPDLASMPSVPEFQPAKLSSISEQLDDFLPSALVDATDNLKRVNSPTLVKSVTEEAVEAFCRDFEFVESMILGADEARDKISIGTSATATTAQTDMGERRRQRRKKNRVMRGEEDAEDEDENWGEGLTLRALFPRTSGEIRVLLS